MLNLPVRIVRPAVILSVILPMLNSQGDTSAVYRVDVNRVVLTFRVTDKKGNHISGLKPEDIRIFEGGIEQKVATCAEGSRLFRLVNDGPGSAGTNVFVLFDTSNRMYTSFPYVCDAIKDFIRQLAPADSVAIYTFSRNLFRAAPLTQN